MAIELIDKIKQKNNGTFKLIDAIDVEMSDGSDAESIITNINKQLNDHIENHPTGGVATANVHVGECPPDNEYLQAWIDTSDDEEFMQDVPDLVLDEFRAIFNSMQEQLSTLKAKIVELEARVYYLELYGGNGGSGGITPSSSNILTFEDGSIMTFEDGSIMTFESSGSPTSKTILSFENNDLMTFEDNKYLIFE